MKIGRQFFFKDFIRKTGFLFFCLILVFAGCFFFLFLKKEKRLLINKKNKKEVISIKNFRLFNISFLQEEKKIKPKLIDLSNKIDLFLHEARPDDLKANSYVEVVLKKTAKKRIVKEDERIYLKFENKNINFSDEKTFFWISFKVEEDKKIKVSFKVKTKSLEKKETVLENFFLLPFQEKKESFSDFPKMKILKEAKYLDEDLFFKIYGNRKEKALACKKRLFFSLGKKDYQLFIEEGDLLIFKDETWIKSNNLLDTKNYDLAQIKAISSKMVKIDLWLKEEKEKKSIIIIKNPVPFSIPNKKFISFIKIRTQKRVSCMVDNKRMVLREKDILLKKNEKWQLEKFSEFKKKRNYDYNFFIFDSIEKSKGKTIFKGYFFEKDGSQVITIRENITNNHERRVHRKRSVGQPHS